MVLNEQLRRLNVVFITGNISDEEYVSETKRIKAEIQKAKACEQERPLVNLAGLKAFLEDDVLSVYDTLEKEDQRRMWRSIIEEIFVDGTTVTSVKFRS